MMDETNAVPISTRITDVVGSLVGSSFESLAQVSFGQTVLKLMDRILWVVEKSAQWSLPVQEVSSDENGKTFGEIELVRPLPWILFLPVIILLRAMRFGLNVGAFIVGYPKIQPSGVVKFVQKRRRQLRTIKNNGLKSMRARKMMTAKDKGLAKNEAKKSLIRSIQLTLSTLSCLDGYRTSPSPPPTRIQVFNNFDTVTALSGEKSSTESTTSPHRADSKRKFFEVATSSSDDSSNSGDETLKSQIDRLASEDSNDDLDFDPEGYSSGGSMEMSIDDDVSITEAMELLVEAKQDLTKLSKSPKKIEEEPIPVEKTKETLTHENSGANQGVEISVGQENYYSPNNFGTDGELAFYSPISSKSVSPERSNSPIKQTQIRESNAKSSDLGNGDLKVNEGLVSSENDISRVPRKDVTNGHVEGKKSTHSGKFNHKHRRSSHGNRKKK